MIALFFALGLLLGFLVGVVIRDALDLLASRKEKRMPLSSPAHRLFTVAFVVSLLFNSAVGVLLIVTRKSAEDYSRCTADWQQEFAAAYQARLAASIDVSEAMDAVVRAVYAQDREAFAKSVRAYVKTRDQQESDRADNPLPPLPDRVCGAAAKVRR